VNAPEPPELRLDGVEPLPAPPRGRGRALARNPFAGAGRPDPALAWETFPFPPPPPHRRAGSTGRRTGPPAAPPAAAGLTERWLGDDVRRRLARLEARPAPDPFGLSPAAVRRALPLLLALYRGWFRVESRGRENLPARGPALLAANHAGLLPFDGAMASLDVWLGTEPPRLPRALFDPFVTRLGPLRRAFEALGPVLASRANLAALLRAGELALVFPEGIDGIVKPMTKRYRLQTFRTGFVRAALAARAPVVPVAIVGSEDQAPILWDVKPLARALGLPAAPITPTFPWLGPLGLVPLPVHYKIVYGEPIDLAEHCGPEGADDPILAAALARRVRRAVQRLLDRSR
jgi:1-acyl-sn-glycerol-3-phosphate acyltransferase